MEVVVVVVVVVDLDVSVDADVEDVVVVVVVVVVVLRVVLASVFLIAPSVAVAVVFKSFVVMLMFVNGFLGIVVGFDAELAEQL